MSENQRKAFKLSVMNESVILVDNDDNMVGTMEKMEAHLQGKLHRAFSIFIFNTKGELLLQRRAINKYHSGGKWTNTCCSHPRLGEETIEAANRRLTEEMGMECAISYVFSFIYCTDIQDEIIEYEYDHVFFGISDAKPVPAQDEVAEVKYMNMNDLEKALNDNPSQYTEWLKICFNEVMTHYYQLFEL